MIHFVSVLLYCLQRWRGKILACSKVAEARAQQVRFVELVKKLSNSLRVNKNTTPTIPHTYTGKVQLRVLQCVTCCIEDRLQTGHSFLVMRS